MPPLEHRAERQPAAAATQQDSPSPLYAPASSTALGRPDRESARRAETPPLSASSDGAPAFRAPQRADPRVPSTLGATGVNGSVGMAGMALRIEWRRNPRLLGALAYAVPLLPALALLLRERRNRFVRAHAAQSLVFFATLALAQVALFALLVLAGGLTTSLRAATVLATLFALAWLALAALGFVTWTRLIAAALAGHVASLPLVTPLARRLLRGLDHAAAALGRGRNDRL